VGPGGVLAPELSETEAACPDRLGLAHLATADVRTWASASRCNATSRGVLYERPARQGPAGHDRAGAGDLKRSQLPLQGSTGAGERCDELTVREMDSRLAARLRAEGKFDPARHAVLDVEPLTPAEHLELLATGEYLARGFRHPTMLDHAAKAGVGWEQIAAARGTGADEVRQGYREWATGQHDMWASTGVWEGEGAPPARHDRRGLRRCAGPVRCHSAARSDLAPGSVARPGPGAISPDLDLADDLGARRGGPIGSLTSGRISA
jgi:hypothetical protein